MPLIDAPPILIVNRFVGETVPGVAAVTGDVTGWALALELCEPPNAWTGSVPVPVQSPAGTWTWAWVTAAGVWPEGEYHWTLWRTTPTPQVLMEVLMNLRDC
jgi:hypothetical protein